MGTFQEDPELRRSPELVTTSERGLLVDMLRPAMPDDVVACGRICYDAFCAINDAHQFPHDFPSSEFTTGLLRILIDHPSFYAVVAERDGRIIGSNFLDERAAVVGVGPISVDPAVQNQGVGRRLMQAVMDRAASRGVPSMRLCQSTFHRRSLCLYTTLGFRTRELLSCMNGRPLKRTLQGYPVRAATLADLAACNALCFDVHGFKRGGELKEAVERGTAMVVERDGQITGYATEVGFFAHSVAKSNADLIALIAAAPGFTGPGFLLPTRNYEVFTWCLANGLRLQYPMTYMTTGLYSESVGAYLVSALY
jgi:GNAT superfamily N-acetyltransferase